MTTALAGGMSPEALAPGDPEGARALAERLEGYAEGAAAAAARLQALESGTWVGEAAEAFRANLDELPQRLSRASASFAEAASALRAYALAAEEARRRAALALTRFDDAQAATARCGSDFGATSPADYANQASEFFQRAQQQGLPTRVDADGVIRAFDPSTNTFGAYSADGTSRTFFRPTSSTYWDRQPGSPPWTG